MNHQLLLLLLAGTLQLTPAYAANIPNTPNAENYYIESTGNGPGIVRYQLYDAQGNQQLTDLGDNGNFYLLSLSGDYVEIDFYTTMHIPTRRQYDDYQLGPSGGGFQYLWKLGPDGGCLRVSADGTMQEYEWAFACNDGEKAMIVRTNDGYARVELATAQIEPLNLPTGVEPVAADGAGRVAVKRGESYGVLTNGVPDGYTLTYIPEFCQYNPGYIGQHNGWYTLYDDTGNPVAGPYADAFGEVGPNIFAYLTGNNIGAVLCTSGETPHTLYENIPCSGTLTYHNQLCYDGTSVFALALDSHNIVFFDRFGNEFGKVSVPFEIQNRELKFIDGLLQVNEPNHGGGIAPQTIWFDPSGNTVKIVENPS